MEPEGVEAAGTYAAADARRWVAEPAKRPGRTAFERDRARVLHSAGLRRLAAKTQVVVPGESDFPRTRLTHSLECAQVGRELGGALGCDPDLVEAACLAHDLGHPPFGHNGEAALAEVAAGCGGFEGNAQSLRLLTRLEPKTFAPAHGPADGSGEPAPGRSVGLNLTRAALDAATKYPWPRSVDPAKFGVYDDDLAVFGWLREGAPSSRRCLEAQVMDWADDIAYSLHDLEDAVHAGSLPLAALHDPGERAGLAALAAVRYGGPAGHDETAYLEALDRVLTLPGWPRAFTGSLADLAGLKNLTSELIGRFARAAERATRAAAGGGPLTRYAADLVVPADVRAESDVLKAVADRFVISGPGAEARYARQRELVHELVHALARRGADALDPALRPAYRAATDDAARQRVVIDAVATLTDASAVQLHGRLTAR